MMGLATLSYVESYQVQESVLRRNYFDGVTATMVSSGFGPYHRMWHYSAPTKCIGVIHTPWVMTHALGLGAVHGVSEHYAPHHTVFYHDLCDTHNMG